MELLVQWRDGRIKMFVIRMLLQFRWENPDIFARGSYAAIPVAGEFAECVVAFERRLESKTLIVIVPRLTSRIGLAPMGEKWKDTALELPSGGPWEELFTGHAFSDGTRYVRQILTDLPVAVLVRS